IYDQEDLNKISNEKIMQDFVGFKKIDNPYFKNKLILSNFNYIFVFWDFKRNNTPCNDEVNLKENFRTRISKNQIEKSINYIETSSDDKFTFFINCYNAGEKNLYISIPFYDFLIGKSGIKSDTRILSLKHEVFVGINNLSSEARHALFKTKTDFFHNAIEFNSTSIDNFLELLDGKMDNIDATLINSSAFFETNIDSSNLRQSIFKKEIEDDKNVSGKLGELILYLFMKYKQDVLSMETGLNINQKIEWTSMMNKYSDHDFKLKDEEENNIYIECKASKNNGLNIFISQNEKKLLEQNPDKYYLARINLKEQKMFLDKFNNVEEYVEEEDYKLINNEGIKFYSGSVLLKDFDFTPTNFIIKFGEN
ncbi:MAG: DUF3883 domain-containing protein, partial [Mycoplasmataceae bacterium]|nr:DUF3883 domain-containing protein [Mycoplasmataceae bacterium]